MRIIRGKRGKRGSLRLRMREAVRLRSRKAKLEEKRRYACASSVAVGGGECDPIKIAQYACPKELAAGQGQKRGQGRQGLVRAEVIALGIVPVQTEVSSYALGKGEGLALGGPLIFLFPAKLPFFRFQKPPFPPSQDST